MNTRACYSGYGSGGACRQRLSGFGGLSLDVETLSHPFPRLLNCCAEAGNDIMALKPTAISANLSGVFIGISFSIVVVRYGSSEVASDATYLFFRFVEGLKVLFTPLALPPLQLFGTSTSTS